MKRKRVFVAMSGGVDSSVAALLLKNQGCDVTGVFMRCYNLDGCAERDAEDARRVAGKLNIPFYVFDFEKAYKKKVVEYMIEGYRKGITPNPDVMCNREIKFGLFLTKALSLGADFIATGHYVRLLRRDCLSKLFEAKDKNKDQSYFLWTLTQEQLQHCLFPIGDYLKSEVRDIARKAGLPTAEKKDSQGICFLGDVDVFDFLKQHIKEKCGDIATVDGKKVGEHCGVWFYTIGQRHGLDLGKKIKEKGNAETPPYYVSGIDIEKNIIIVAKGSDDLALFRTEIELADVNFISSKIQHTYIPGYVGMSVRARVRYRQPLARAVLVREEKEKEKKELWKLVFDEPVKFVAPGQSAVFYGEDGEMLGGGVISKSVGDCRNVTFLTR